MSPIKEMIYLSQNRLLSFVIPNVGQILNEIINKNTSRYKLQSVNYGKPVALPPLQIGTLSAGSTITIKGAATSNVWNQTHARRSAAFAPEKYVRRFRIESNIAETGNFIKKKHDY